MPRAEEGEGQAVLVFRFYVGGTDETHAWKVRVLFDPNFCVKLL